MLLLVPCAGQAEQQKQYRKKLVLYLLLDPKKNWTQYLTLDMF